MYPMPRLDEAAPDDLDEDRLHWRRSLPALSRGLIDGRSRHVPRATIVQLQAVWDMSGV